MDKIKDFLTMKSVKIIVWWIINNYNKLFLIVKLYILDRLDHKLLVSLNNKFKNIKWEISIPSLIVCK